MTFDIQTLAVAGILVVLLADKVLAVLKGQGVDLRRIARQIDDLHKWHDVRDEDGVPVWHLKRSMFSAIERLTRAVEKSNETQREVIGALRDRQR